MTETVVQKLKIAGLQGVEGHHGSMDKNIRLDVEQKLKHGLLRCVVSSSSLEMGIDIGSVDLVIQVASGLYCHCTTTNRTRWTSSWGITSCALYPVRLMTYSNL